MPFIQTKIKMDDVYLKQNLNDQNLHFVKHFVSPIRKF